MKTNIQYERTDKAIINTFTRLLQKKPIDKITVQEILDETPVNRATFYTHFKDKYEIAERMQAQVLDNIKSLSFLLFSEEYGHSHQKSNKIFNEYRAEYRESLLALLKVKTDTVDVIRFWANDIRKEYLSSSHSETANIEAHIYSNIITGLMTYTIESNESQLDIMNNIIMILLNVLLKTLSLEDDKEVNELLNKKLLK